MQPWSKNTTIIKLLLLLCGLLTRAHLKHIVDDSVRISWSPHFVGNMWFPFAFPFTASRSLFWAPLLAKGLFWGLFMVLCEMYFKIQVLMPITSYTSYKHWYKYGLFQPTQQVEQLKLTPYGKCHNKQDRELKAVKRLLFLISWTWLSIPLFKECLAAP